MFYNTTTGEIRYSTNKTFVIDHPTQKDKYLVHACLEGPEAGVYYRGSGSINGKSIIINLPDYVKDLATDLKAYVTCIGNPVLLGVSKVLNGSFNVLANEIVNCEFNWIVYGSRGLLEVEPKRNNVNVYGDGPYKWIS